MAGLNKDDVDLHFNTNQFNEDDHAEANLILLQSPISNQRYRTGHYIFNW